MQSSGTKGTKVMRVYVVEASAKGGLIHYAFHLCRAMQRIGVEMTLVTSTSYELRALEHNFRVVELLRLWDPRGKKSANFLWRKVRRGWRGVQYVSEWVRLIRFLTRERPDVVLFGEMRFSFEVYFLKLLRRSGLVLADIVHDVEPYDTSRGSEQIVASREQIATFEQIYAQFDYLFVHDASNYQRFLALYNIPSQRVHTIFLPTSELMLEVAQSHTPESLRRELGVVPNRPVILFFGTITKYKGLEDLIRAFPKIYEATGAQLIVAGFPAKDVDAGELQALARALQIDSQIAWYLDYVPNEWVATLMAISDLVVLPYRAITQSGILQIAYACGKPVVATRVGGLPDIVEDGKSGLLAAPGDPESLANTVIEALRSPEQLEAMGAYARTLAESKYSWDVLARKLHEIFANR
ncbi:MAG: hypothetical protein Kow0077_28770 [Anaerolineae bacterium]